MHFVRPSSTSKHAHINSMLRIHMNLIAIKAQTVISHRRSQCEPKTKMEYKWEWFGRRTTKMKKRRNHWANETNMNANTILFSSIAQKVPLSDACQRWLD